jgi:hypothetical protein
MDKVFEAFAPSGTELPDISCGLFMGDRELIGQWVAENSHYWWPQQIKLFERKIRLVTPGALAKLRAAKATFSEAKKIIEDASK